MRNNPLENTKTVEEAPSNRQKQRLRRTRRGHQKRAAPSIEEQIEEHAVEAHKHDANFETRVVDDIPSRLALDEADVVFVEQTETSSNGVASEVGLTSNIAEQIIITYSSKPALHPVNLTAASQLARKLTGQGKSARSLVAHALQSCGAASFTTVLRIALNETDDISASHPGQSSENDKRNDLNEEDTDEEIVWCTGVQGHGRQCHGLCGCRHPMGETDIFTVSTKPWRRSSAKLRTLVHSMLEKHVTHQPPSLRLPLPDTFSMPYVPNDMRPRKHAFATGAYEDPSNQDGDMEVRVSSQKSPYQSYPNSKVATPTQFWSKTPSPQGTPRMAPQAMGHMSSTQCHVAQNLWQ